MGTVYRNLRDMEIPPIGFVDRHDGRVFIVVIDDDGKRHRKSIGYMTDSTPGHERMVPNDYFKSVYQDLFTEEYPNEKIPAHELSIGMYALTLGICQKRGLYAILQEVYGMEYVNNILDYAMYSISFMSSTTQMFEKYMANKVLFANKLHSDSWYSVFFSKKINEDQHHQLKIMWVQMLVNNGLENVWLGIDGSNNDCEARRSFLSQFGFPKSHNKNKTIVGYMYAVDAENGRPVTYFTYEGSVPDCQEFQRMATFLGGFKIKIKGVILDRGFATEEVFKKIEEEKWKYVVMLPTDTYGHTEMEKEYSEQIRWKSERMLDDDVIFGISDTKRLFGNHGRCSNICLFFDGGSGSQQSVRLSRKIQSARRNAEKGILVGKKASIPKELQKYLTIEGKGKERTVVVHYEEWDKKMASKGFFSPAVSEGISPQEASSLYKKRDTSEKQFSILKSQEGADVTRVHKTEGIYSKFAVSFIASLIRFEIEETCKGLGLDTNPLIQGMEHIALLYTAEGKYEAVRNLTTEQKAVLGIYGLDNDRMGGLARDFNRRNRTGSRNPERRLPEMQIAVTNTHKRGRPSARSEKTDDTKSMAVSEDLCEKSKGGRPKGSKDTQPRKPRSDKGKKRGKRNNVGS